MKNISRDTWLAIGLFLTLLIITIIAAVQNMQQPAPPLSSFSSEPNGAKALRLWLEELDYTIYQPLVSSFVPPKEANLILILEPFVQITDDEWRLLDRWVDQGGTLVVAGERVATVVAFRHYDMNLRLISPDDQALVPQTPLWRSPVAEPAEVQAGAYFQTSRRDFVTHAAIDDKPVIISFKQGQGRVWLSATSFPFSNQGLKEAGNATFVLNMLTTANDGGGVWFNEWHHGLRARPDEVLGPVGSLRYTSVGRALLYIGLVIFVGLILRGQQFGRPVPLAETMTRRAPLEYITAIANLGRRAGHRTATLAHYRHRLKRELGRRYRLNPTLPDEEYLAQLAQFNSNLDISALSTLLAKLRRKQVTESEMIQLAADVTTWLKE